MGKSALITGITGQDGSYLAELLLEKGYRVHGLVRRSSSFSTGRIDHLYKDIHDNPGLLLHYGDLTDGQALTNLVLSLEPDEIYNLGGSESRSSLLRSTGLHINDRRRRCLERARSRQDSQPEEKSTGLPSELVRNVRCCAGNPSNGINTLQPSEPLRVCQSLRVLPNHQLPTKLWPFRLQWHPLQS